MTKNVAQIDYSSGSGENFAHLFDRVNELANAMSNSTVTVDESITTGNAVVNGTIQTLNLYANTISGGVIGTPGPITVSSNLTITGTNNIFGAITDAKFSGANNSHNIVGANSVTGALYMTRALENYANSVAHATDQFVKHNGTNWENITANAVADVIKDASVSGNGSSFALANSFTHTGNTSFTNIETSGNGTISGLFSATGAATFANNITVSGNVVAQKHLLVTNTSTFSNTVTISSNVTVNNTATFNAYSLFSGNASFTSNVSLSGISTFTNVSNFSGNTSFTSNVSLSGISAFTGNATFSADLNSSGTSTFSGNTLYTESVANTDDSTKLATTSFVHNSIKNSYGNYKEKNYIMNGNFMLWQRSTSSANSIGYTADRWKHNRSAANSSSHTQQSALTRDGTIPGDPQYGLAIYGAGGPLIDSTTGYEYLRQSIEDGLSLAGKKITITFWAKATADGDEIAVTPYFYYGSTGSGTDFHTSTKIALTTSMTRYDIVLDLPDLTGKTVGGSNISMGVDWWINAGSNYASRTDTLGINANKWMTIARVSVVEGDARGAEDPYEYVSFVDNLKMCERYYQKIGSDFPLQLVATSNTTYRRYQAPRAVKMRVDPTESATITGTGGTTLADSGQNGDENVYNIYGQLLSSSAWIICSNYTADADY